jgi:hypothetical protein
MEAISWMYALSLDDLERNRQRKRRRKPADPHARLRKQVLVKGETPSVKECEHSLNLTEDGVFAMVLADDDLDIRTRTDRVSQTTGERIVVMEVVPSKKETDR